MYVAEYGKEHEKGLLLLHGAAACDGFAGQIDCLAAHFHLLAPHLPGAGEAVNELYDRESAVESLRALLIARGGGPYSVVGHSLGAELAVALVCRYPSLFARAAFLSPWVCATKRSCDFYVRQADNACASFKWEWLVRLQGKYWHYSDAQARYMAQYAAKITPAQYAAWFSYDNRVRLDEERGYADVAIPMLAVCGRGETAQMKRSVEALAQRNAHCQMRVLPGGHDFPQRHAAQLNPLLTEFLTGE